ncbi:helix-turn-helix domain-containing protein [Dactylosporangium sp. CA-092794]|uniref:helix-turn-helix domain-containing protein n=1 Tax=Dactylosporangium sp. CA-092794 TaxID=3239929 RepID=UPI003D8A9D33
MLDLRRHDLASLAFRPVGRDNPIADVASALLVQLAADARLRDDPHADLAMSAALGVVRAALLSELSPMRVSVSAGDDLRQRIVGYVRARLDDPELSPQRMADAHHISLRQLYTVLSWIGTTPARLVRRLRLEAAREELGRGVDLPVAAVGRRWGFVDPTSFGRVFRREYGMTPMEYRRMHAGNGTVRRP